MDVLQQIQDDEYSFPYHYVSEFRNCFTQCYYDSWGINYVSTIEFLLKKLGEEKFQSLIDVGCGEGRLSREILTTFPNKKVLGVDYSERAIKLAQSLNPQGSYMHLDIIAQPPPEKFDVAILMEVFEHIPPDTADEFAKSVARLIKPGGILYVTVPHVNKPVEYKHYRHFTGNLLRECFAPYFNAVETVPFEKGKKRKAIIDFLLGNRFFILNSPRLRKMIYRYYVDNLFLATEDNCNRVLVKFQVR